LEPAAKLRPDAARLGELCLMHLAESPDLLQRFMEVAGYDPASLRAAVDSDSLAHGLIDYFASNEALMMAVCANSGISPESFMRTWHRLNRSE